MEIHTGCMLIFGLPGEELADRVTGKLKKAVIKEGFLQAMDGVGGIGLEVAIPFNGAAPEECVWGILLEGDLWTAAEIDVDALPEKLAWAGKKFKKMTGLDGRLFVSADVTSEPSDCAPDCGSAFPFHGAAPLLGDGASLRAYLAAHAPEVPGGIQDIEAKADTLVRWRLHYADMMVEALK